jgi:hypothetical protein
MNHKKLKIFLKASVAISILFILLIPVSIIVSATDTTPPTISQFSAEPNGIMLQGSLDFYVDCLIQDSNSGVADARIIMTGPAGFTPINDSLIYYDWYEYGYELIDNTPILGSYFYYVWAVDNAGNSVTTQLYNFTILSPMDYVHVDVSNSAGPWDGTATHPLRTINDGYLVVNPGGTIFIHNGVYYESMLIFKRINVIGESKENTILDGIYSENIREGIKIDAEYVNISNVTIQHWSYAVIQRENPRNYNLRQCNIGFNTMGIILTGTTRNAFMDCNFYNNSQAVYVSCSSSPVTNKSFTNCNIFNNIYGINFEASYAHNNVFYHNNFINNFHHVWAYYGLNSNVWDDGITGNYWDDYTTVHPNAHIIPSTGTWNMSYVVKGVNVDYHPWVYPNGYIDAILPTIGVTYPNGGETVYGQILITWSASDDLTSNLNGTIGISYSTDAGNTWSSIAQNLDNSGSYAWDTNTVSDGAQYLIKVYANDEFQNVGFDVSDDVFTILNHPNQIPEIPHSPVGPTTGEVNVSYDYSTNTTDIDGDMVYYKWSWGAEESIWMGPYASGDVCNASHVWAAPGTYEIKVKAKDANGAESDWSTGLAVTITAVSEKPNLVVKSIKEFFGLNVVLQNNGAAYATNITWTINIQGGFVLDRNHTNMLYGLNPGKETMFGTEPIIGLGRVTIHVLVTCEEGVSTEKTVTGFVLLFLVIGIQDA